MINNDRIVPIQKIDFLSLIGTIYNLNDPQDPITVLEASSVDGAFSVTESSSRHFLANQPVKTIDFAKSVTDAFVFFVAAYDFAGFTVAGEAVTPTGDTVKPDGISLYMAGPFNGTVKVVAVTPSVD